MLITCVFPSAVVANCNDGPFTLQMFVYSHVSQLFAPRMAALISGEFRAMSK